MEVLYVRAFEDFQGPIMGLAFHVGQQLSRPPMDRLNVHDALETRAHLRAAQLRSSAHATVVTLDWMVVHALLADQGRIVLQEDRLSVKCVRATRHHPREVLQTKSVSVWLAS